jgi:hypothetical protein
VVALILEPARFEHRRGQLFDEQRDAIGPDQDLFDDFRRQHLAARNLVQHGRAVIASEARQRQAHDVRVTVPIRIELRPMGDQKQHRKLPDALHQERPSGLTGVTATT